MIIGLAKADQATSNRAVIIFILFYKIIIMSHPPQEHFMSIARIVGWKGIWVLHYSI